MLEALKGKKECFVIIIGNMMMAWSLYSTLIRKDFLRLDSVQKEVFENKHFFNLNKTVSLDSVAGS